VEGMALIDPVLAREGGAAADVYDWTHHSAAYSERRQILKIDIEDWKQ
jgi:hypothetical protein